MLIWYEIHFHACFFREKSIRILQKGLLYQFKNLNKIEEDERSENGNPNAVFNTTLTIFSFYRTDIKCFHKFLNGIVKNGGTTEGLGELPRLRKVLKSTPVEEQLDFTANQVDMFKEYCIFEDDEQNENIGPRKFVKMVQCGAELEDEKGYCKEMFLIKHNYYEHIRSKHRKLLNKLPLKERKFQCIICGEPKLITKRSFNKVSSL